MREIFPDGERLDSAAYGPGIEECTLYGDPVHGSPQLPAKGQILPTPMALDSRQYQVRQCRESGALRLGTGDAACHMVVADLLQLGSPGFRVLGNESSPAGLAADN